jgi:hypothetical protein
MEIRESQTDNDTTPESEPLPSLPKEDNPMNGQTDSDTPEHGSDTDSEESSGVHIESVDDAVAEDELTHQITLVHPDGDSNDQREVGHVIALDDTEDVPDEEAEDLVQINSTVRSLSESFRNPRMKVKQYTLERVMDEISKSEYPIPELRGFTKATELMLADFVDDNWKFETIYFRDRVLSDNLPGCAHEVLRRTRKFGDAFYQNAGVRHIAGFLGVLVKLSTKFIQQDTINLRNLGKEEQPQLFSSLSLRLLMDMLKTNADMSLFETLRSAGYSTALWFPLVLDIFAIEGGFLDSLLLFVKQMFENLPAHPKLLSFLWDVICLCTGLVKCIESIRKAASFIGDLDTLQSLLTSRLSDIFIAIEDGYRKCIKTPQQSLDPALFIQQTCLLGSLAQALYSASPSNPTLVSRMKKEIDTLYKVTPPEEFGALAEWTVKFPILYGMLTSSRMEFRLRGLTHMTESLVHAWRTGGGLVPKAWKDTPLVPYLIAFISKHKLVEYLVGPDSHYELISRCGNVPSFLLVSDNLTPEIADALWQPVANNRDRRIIQATLQMHEDMMNNMELPHILDVCGKICRMPFTSFDTSIMDFVGQVVDKIRSKHQDRVCPK